MEWVYKVKGKGLLIS